MFAQLSLKAYSSQEPLTSALSSDWSSQKQPWFPLAPSCKQRPILGSGSRNPERLRFCPFYTLPLVWPERSDPWSLESTAAPREWDWQLWAVLRSHERAGHTLPSSLSSVSCKEEPTGGRAQKSAWMSGWSRYRTVLFNFSTSCSSMNVTFTILSQLINHKNLIRYHISLV